MFDEIEKFLRQAAEAAAAAQQQQQNKSAGQQPRRPIGPPQPQRTGSASQGDQSGGRSAGRGLVPDVEIIEAELQEEVGPGRRLARDFRSSAAIAEHTRHLGEEVGLADDHLEAHLHEVFDHKVGTLKKRGGDSTTDDAAVIAAGPQYEMTAAISLLISSRSNMRAAMLLGEILRRPEENW